MVNVDYIKETIGYLKLKLAIVAATDLILILWLADGQPSMSWLYVTVLTAVIGLTITGFLLARNISKWMKRLQD